MCTLFAGAAPLRRCAPAWTLQSNESGAALGGREGRGDRGCSATFLENSTRHGEFRVLEHWDSSLCSRTGGTMAKAQGVNPSQIRVNSARERARLVSHPLGKWHASPVRNAPFPAALSTQRSCVNLPAPSQPREVPCLHRNQSPPVLPCRCCEVSTTLNKKLNLAQHELTVQESE